MSEPNWKLLDKWWPPRGPCGFCNGPDARHRVWDTIQGRHKAGDSIEVLVKDYGVSRRAIEACLALEPEQDDAS